MWGVLGFLLVSFFTVTSTEVSVFSETTVTGHGVFGRGGVL